MCLFQHFSFCFNSSYTHPATEFQILRLFSLLEYLLLKTLSYPGINTSFEMENFRKECNQCYYWKNDTGLQNPDSEAQNVGSNSDTTPTRHVTVTLVKLLNLCTSVFFIGKSDIMASLQNSISIKYIHLKQNGAQYMFSINVICHYYYYYNVSFIWTNLPAGKLFWKNLGERLVFNLISSELYFCFHFYA